MSLYFINSPRNCPCPFFCILSDLLGLKQTNEPKSLITIKFKACRSKNKAVRLCMPPPTG